MEKWSLVQNQPLLKTTQGESLQARNSLALSLDLIFFYESSVYFHSQAGETKDIGVKILPWGQEH